ncbi:GNAT family N-acetyltransferase [Priestia koreensis]|uniref:GNAT family N-acetyltransferase n=1 Tax=Priestia koreensis TaxID=284581 RepID=UPI0006A9EFEE|nr:GNAT family N-acetyltransferase [Priestia koreensis]
MHKIHEYKSIESLLTEQVPSFVHAVIEGQLQGEIWVDHLDAPSCAIVSTWNGVHSFLGKAGNLVFDKWLVHYINKKSSGGRFTVFDPEDGFKRLLQQTSLSFQTHLRIGYRWEKRELPSINHAIPIGQQEVELSTIFTESYYGLWWDSVDAFLAKGIGVCIKDGEDLVGECVSIFKTSEYAEVDIEVNPKARGKGIGYEIGCAFITECLQLGVEPRWDCDQDNLASQRLAQKLGFIKGYEYPLYSLTSTSS